MRRLGGGGGDKREDEGVERKGWGMAVGEGTMIKAG